MTLFFFFNDTATTEIYTLSLHDALPISHVEERGPCPLGRRDQRESVVGLARSVRGDPFRDRKSTRLNSSHLVISYAVFCLKKKKTHRLLQQNFPAYKYILSESMLD